MLDYVIRNSSTKRLAGERGRENRRYFYRRLMHVAIRNNYYNASGHLCPDFNIYPTAASAALMKSLGLMFQTDGSGFSVLLDRFQEEAFLDYLRSQAIPPASPPDGSLPGVWSRLSFALIVKNPNFFNFTDISSHITTSIRTFFLSNTAAVKTKSGRVLLALPNLKGTESVPVTGSQYRVDLPPAGVNTAQRVIVRGLSGAIALCQPVYWPRNSPLAPYCAESEAEMDTTDSPPSGMIYRNPIYLDFSTLPEDKYQVELCANVAGDCQPMAHGTEEVVFSASAGTPLCFIDLLFANPGLDTGVYPVKDLYGAAGGEIVPTEYFLDFERRSTTWNYYVVSTGAALRDLRIETLAPHTTPPITFTGPAAVELPYKQLAALFVSDSAIPLEEQSSYNFQLLGRAGGVQRKNGVLMNRLPVASAQQVIPGDSDFATRNPESPAGSDPQPGTNFSDIYVYV